MLRKINNEHKICALLYSSVVCMPSEGLSDHSDLRVFLLTMPYLIQNIFELTCTHIFFLTDVPYRLNKSFAVGGWGRERLYPQLKTNKQKKNFFQSSCSNNWLLYHVPYFHSPVLHSKSVSQKIIFLPPDCPSNYFVRVVKYA